MKKYSATKNGLRRHIQSGTYYINVTVNGRHIGESTSTTSLKAARIIADKRLVELRGVQADRGRVATLGDCANIWQGRLEGRNVTALTLSKHLTVLASIKKSWPEAFGGLFDSQPPTSVGFDDLLGWRKAFCKPAKGRQRHHDYANRAVWILRELFEIAREFGAYTRANPTGRMELLSGPRQDLVMPTDQQMAALIEELRHGEPHAPKAVMEHVGDYCQGLAWTGLRRNEALALRREHVDLEAWRIYLPAHLVKGGKNGRIVPILAEARPLFARLCQACTPEDPGVFKVGRRLRSLDRACKKVGIPRLTFHKFRHYFATKLYEETGNAQLVAQVLGHVDGGKLVHDTYAHVRDDFIDKALANVRFTADDKIVPLPKAGGG